MNRREKVLVQRSFRSKLEYWVDLIGAEIMLAKRLVLVPSNVRNDKGGRLEHLVRMALSAITAIEYDYRCFWIPGAEYQSCTG
jgi:hypothetical protein